MKWIMAEPDSGAAAALAERADIHPLIARLLVIRGIIDPVDARSFLDCDLSTLSDPGIFTHMEKAVGRVRTAVSAGEKIVVYGDYDVDGVTGSSLLYLALKGLGASVESYIPDRMTEGYGLNDRALEVMKARGVGLVISVDCGITAFREAKRARELELDLIITDHHEINHQNGAVRIPSSPVELPEAYAVLHPALVSADTAPALRVSVSGLTGVGIAFKLVPSLLGLDIEDLSQRWQGGPGRFTEAV